MLYGMSIAKIVFPLLTLPYLTRVLSVESYGVVSYVKAVMQYMQIAVDFGFMLSGTKDIVNAKADQRKIGKGSGDILLARILLAATAFVALLGMIAVIPLLRANIEYTLLAFVTVFLSVFLFDYFFQGIEKMQYCIAVCYHAWYCNSYDFSFLFIQIKMSCLFLFWMLLVRWLQYCSYLSS